MAQKRPGVQVSKGGKRFIIPAMDTTQSGHDNDGDSIMSDSTTSSAPPSTMNLSGAGSGSKDIAGGRGGHGGGLGNVAEQVSNHSSTPFTITSAGTTWLNTTDTGNVGVDWATFPWEFPQLFMSNVERVDLFNNHLFWRTNKVEITFKNFRGFVNTVPATGTDPQTFPTDNAAFQTYLDEMYYLGLQTAPFISDLGWADSTSLGTIVRSWQKGGYDAANRVSLPLIDITVSENFENIISQNYPNVTQTQGIPGEVVYHQWHTHGDKYWRCTSEFINGMTPVTLDASPTPPNPLIWTLNNRLFRADQVGGFLLSGCTKMPFNRKLFNAIEVGGIAAEPNIVADIPPAVYTTHEPIPPLLLRIVPQHIEGNGNSTHLQFDFEIKYHISTRCKIARHGYTNSTADFTLPAGLTLPTGSEGKNRPGCATQVVPVYPATLANASVASQIIPLNGYSIQRGRVKNGFVFIPYMGWETAVRIPVTVPPNPANPVRYNTMADLYNKAHCAAIDINGSTVPFDTYIDAIWCRRVTNPPTDLYYPLPAAEVLYALELQKLWLTAALDTGVAGDHLTLGTFEYNYIMIANYTIVGDINTITRNLYQFTTIPIPDAVQSTGERLGIPSDTSDAKSVVAYLESRILTHLDQ